EKQARQERQSKAPPHSRWPNKLPPRGRKEGEAGETPPKRWIRVVDESAGKQSPAWVSCPTDRRPGRRACSESKDRSSPVAERSAGGWADCARSAPRDAGCGGGGCAAGRPARAGWTAGWKIWVSWPPAWGRRSRA